MTTNQQEINHSRNLIYRQMMTVPHRKYDEPVVQLRAALETDPDFIARACVYLNTASNAIRDQKDIAIITLLQAMANFPQYREAGRVLFIGNDVYGMPFPSLPPYRIFRIARFIAQSQYKIPRLMKSIMTAYIKMLENDHIRFDGVTIQNRRNLKWVYTHYHIEPSDRAQAVLFDDNPPADSKMAIIKKIANSTDPTEQATLVVKNKIPPRIAMTIMPKNAQTGVALIDRMTPTEALNARKWVESSGLLEIPPVKAIFLEKIKEAHQSGASIDHRASAQGSDEEVQEAVEIARQKATDKLPRIERDLLMLIDKSASMDEALGLAVKFGARIAPLCEKELMVVVHNNYGQIIEVENKNNLKAWEQAFQGQTAGGGTNMQRGFETALEAGFMPQAVVMLTDGGERLGNFTEIITKYNEQNNIDTQITMIKIPSNDSNFLGPQLTNTELRYDEFEYTGDYILFDQVVAILGGEAPKSVIEQILETELPKRQGVRL